MSRVVRERNTPSQCFSTIVLDSGDYVMISIAAGSVKLLRMKWRGAIPAGTLWHSTDPDVTAAMFLDPDNPTPHPLDSIRNAVLMHSSLEELQAFLASGGYAAVGPEQTGDSAYDLNEVMDLETVDEIRRAYAGILEDRSGPYANCMFKPASLLPYPKPVIAAALNALLDAAEGRTASALLGDDFGSSDTAATIRVALDTLDDFLNVPADSLPVEPAANARVGNAMRRAHAE